MYIDILANKINIEVHLGIFKISSGSKTVHFRQHTVDINKRILQSIPTLKHKLQ